MYANDRDYNTVSAAESNEVVGGIWRKSIPRCDSVTQICSHTFSTCHKRAASGRVTAGNISARARTLHVSSMMLLGTMFG